MLARVRGTLLVAGLLAAMLVISACGSSSPSASYAKTAPSKILSDSVNAMSSAKSIQVDGQTDVNSGSAQVSIAIQLPSNVSASIDSAVDGLVKFRVANASSYLYADSKFWGKELTGASAAQLAKFANKWFKAPAATTASLTKDLGAVTPKELSTCLKQAAYDPKVTGTATVNGVSTVELHFTSGHPGASPGNLYVAAAAPHYPVRFQQTGKAQAGGSSACADGATSSDNGKGVLNFSQWNAVKVTAPPNASALPGS